MTDWLRIIGGIAFVVLVLVVVMVVSEHQENACANVGGHSKYVGYGKSRTMICLSPDGRLIEDY